MAAAASLTALRPVFIAGYPGDIGGADTECWHTAKLWRRFGLDVTFLPTSRPAGKWHAWLEETGFLAEDDDELASYATRLARGDHRCLEVAHRARRHLTEQLAEPEAIWGKWRRVFDELA
jgi:hypothetical protein